MKARINKTLFTFVISLIVIFSLLNLSETSVNAWEDDNMYPPHFPTCESKIFNSVGDHDHSENGNFYIIGLGWRYGTDDVYNLGNGNFLQCYCPNDRTTGIQSDWWNADLAGLTDHKINHFKNSGWFVEEGSDRNLPDDTFLVRNREFSCSQPTPVVTATPTVTFTPTITPTPGLQSRCFDLEAQPTEGSVPLTVKFIGHADDPIAGGRIKEYRFDFADSSGGQSQVWHQADSVAYHRYELPGEYEAKLRVQDNAGNWRESDDCKVKIKVNSTPQVLGVKSPTELPTAGASALFIASVVPLTFAGRYLYRRFKLVN